MAQKEDAMRIMYERCCGLDIHKASIAACALITDKGKTLEETRRFGTMTADLRELAVWLQQKEIRHVAMESTGIYWKPVWNILEPAGFELLLANAQEVKVVPGRKTDQKERCGKRFLNCGARLKDRSRRIIDCCLPDTGTEWNSWSGRLRIWKPRSLNA